MSICDKPWAVVEFRRRQALPLQRFAREKLHRWPAGILEASVSLASGSRLGPYEILAPVGAGGMGEVYRARDTRLDRQVAIKVLPSVFSQNPHLRERFEREARAISKLSHPNICTLHDVGRHDSVDYLVMELLEGEALADRLARGPLPIDQTLRYGIEIARALEIAHRHGIVHRDLKPGNIMITRSGAKLLDFGLAKYTNPPPIALSPQSGEGPTEHKPLTHEGTLLGTLQYMAPEQLEGREADARTDIFAFGAILYEMATGTRAFSGKSKASLIGSIMEHEPAPISTVRPMTPPALDRIVRVCLEKDPEGRWQSAQDVALQLEAVTTPEVRPTRRFRWIALAGAVGLAALITGLLVGRTLWMEQRESALARPVHMDIFPPERAFLSLFRQDTLLAVSPDGRHIALVVIVDGQTRLWVRDLDSDESMLLPGTEEALSPFWSPDSQMIGFHSGGRLKKTDLRGGPPQTICPISNTGAIADWGPDGTILFVENSGVSGIIKRVPATGGKPVQIGGLLDPKNPRSRWRGPKFLPDGKHFLANARYGPAGSRERALFVRSLDGKVVKRLFDTDSKVTFVPPDLVLFVREGVLMAHRFDLDRLGTFGDPVPVASPVHYFEPTSAAHFDASDSVLVYQPVAGANQLVWVDLNGAVVGSLGEVEPFQAPAISPDGRRVAVSLPDAKAGLGDIWIYDLTRGFRSRIGSRTGFESFPVWSPDGSRIVFSADRGGAPHLHMISLADPEIEERLTDPDFVQWATDWSPDGKSILFSKDSATGATDIWLLPLDKDRKPVPLMAGDASERDGHFSPDGRWIALSSDETGVPEVYTAPVDRPKLRVRVSTDGGSGPRWNADGTELYYINARSELLSVPVKRAAELEFGAPRVLMRREENLSSSQEIDQDYTFDRRTGRFLMNRASSGRQAVPVKVIVNWKSHLPR